MTLSNPYNKSAAQPLIGPSAATRPQLLNEVARPTIEQYEAWLPGSGVMPNWRSPTLKAVSVGIAPDSAIDTVIVKPKNGPAVLIAPGSPYPPGQWEGPFEFIHTHTNLRTRPDPAAGGSFTVEAGALGIPFTPEYLSVCFWPTVESMAVYPASKRAPRIVQYLNCTGPAGAAASMGGESVHGRKRIGIHIATRTRDLNYYIVGFKFSKEKVAGTARNIQGNLVASAAAPRVLTTATVSESWLIENETWDYVQMNAFFSIDNTGRLDIIYDMRDDA